MAKCKSMILTVKHLEKIEACPSGISWFEDTFPNGVKISNSQDEMNELVASIDWYDNDGQNSYFHTFTVLEYLQFFLNRMCCKDLYAYNNKYGDAVSIMEDEYFAHEGGAFLSDCMFLNEDCMFLND